ncbi:nickel pincer cofactor biosynthesis protein LarB, partial [Enterococcus faecalis]
EQSVAALLHQVRNGEIEIQHALDQLRLLPIELLNSARLDHHRTLRTGLPEAVFGENKTVEQLIEILGALLRVPNVVVATRVSPEKGEAACQRLNGLTYHPVARMLTGNEAHAPADGGRGTVVIVTAGTSDLPVAEEASVTLQTFGHRIATVHDAGVAGIHRILAHSALLQQGSVIIVVAGMEGALPSVVAGMTAAPVIGVPT